MDFSRLARIPSPLAGLALGISGLGNALELAFPTGMWVPAAFALAVPMVLVVLAKLLLNPEVLRAEAGHPVLGAMPVACSMVLMLFSGALHASFPALSAAVWIPGFLLSTVPCAVFFLLQYRARKHATLLPSWFLALGGLLVSATTVPFAAMGGMTYFLMLFGAAAYFALFPFVFVRVLRSAPLPPAQLPVMAIFAAPTNLVIASWLTMHPDVPAWGWPVIAMAAALNIWIYMRLPRLMSVPFTPALAALTFPMAITATASLKLAALYPAFTPAAYAETVVAAAVIPFVFFRYLLRK